MARNLVEPEISRALVMAPAFMLLDEPFAGIDPLSVVDIQMSLHADADAS